LDFLRHSFAIKTLKRVKECGKSPQNALPYLAQYMGHVKYENTAVYLKVLDSTHRNDMINFCMSELMEDL
jgi:hypothetical protein